MRIGSIHTGKIVIYPIVDNVDGEGNQLINWMAEIKQRHVRQERLEQARQARRTFYSIYEDWSFDWLDVAALIRDADPILEYPMVDKDPIDALDLRPRHARRRRRASDVSARLERRGAGARSMRACWPIALRAQPTSARRAQGL